MPPIIEPEKFRLPIISPKCDGERLWRCADNRDVALAMKQVDVGIDIVIGGDGVEDEIEAASVLLHLVGIAGDYDRVGAETKSVLLFIW